MQMLGGSYGTGSAFYSPHSKIISIHPDKILSRIKKFHVNDINSLQQLDSSTKKKIGETVSLGGVGMLVGGLFGPLGGLAGLAAGAMSGGRNSHVIFGVNTEDNENFLFSAKTSEFFAIQADVSKHTSKLKEERTKIQIRKSSRATDQARIRISSLQDSNNLSSKSSKSIKSRLEELKALEDEGVISFEDYEEQRLRIISDI